MKQHIILTILVASILSFNVHSIYAAGPPPLTDEQSRDVAAHYRHWQFSGLKLDEQNTVNYGFLQRNQDTTDNILLIFLDGSGYRSAFGLKEGERWVRPNPPYSFAKNVFPDYDFLVPEKVNIAIGDDHSGDSTVESARVVAAEFEKSGKSNLTYYEYADMGHGPATPEQRDRFIGDLQNWLSSEA